MYFLHNWQDDGVIAIAIGISLVNGGKFSLGIQLKALATPLLVLMIKAGFT